MSADMLVVPGFGTEETNEGHEAVKTTVELQRRVLAKTKTEKNNKLALTNKFEAVGSNGIFGAYPGIVKFGGFELLKTHTMKVRLINNSA